MNHTTATPPTPERRTRPRRCAACTSNQCHQGHLPCPTPQACELPDEEPPTTMEITGLVLMFTVFAVVIVLALYAGTGA